MENVEQVNRDLKTIGGTVILINFAVYFDRNKLNLDDCDLKQVYYSKGIKMGEIYVC